jgi:hypothetical protein
MAIKAQGRSEPVKESVRGNVGGRVRLPALPLARRRWRAFAVGVAGLMAGVPLARLMLPYSACGTEASSA